jgi:hypothetical protein
VTQSTYAPPSEAKPSEFSTSFKTLSHPTSDSLDEYKKRWLTGTDAAVTSTRFQTENRAKLGGEAANGFRPRPVRVMRGVPKSVETFRNKIVERGGMLAIRSIGRLFRIMDTSGDHKISQTELR